MANLFLDRMEAARADRLASRYGPKGRTFTVGDLMDAIWSVDNESDAREFFAGHVADIQRQIDEGTWKGPATPEHAARSNIGWMYGEGMAPERIAMWRRATGSEHPVFGTALPTTPEEAIKTGQDFAQRGK